MIQQVRYPFHEKLLSGPIAFAISTTIVVGHANPVTTAKSTTMLQLFRVSESWRLAKAIKEASYFELP